MTIYWLNSENSRVNFNISILFILSKLALKITKRATTSELLFQHSRSAFRAISIQIVTKDYGILQIFPACQIASLILGCSLIPDLRRKRTERAQFSRIISVEKRALQSQKITSRVAACVRTTNRVLCRRRMQRKLGNLVYCTIKKKTVNAHAVNFATNTKQFDTHTRFSCSSSPRCFDVSKRNAYSSFQTPPCYLTEAWNNTSSKTTVASSHLSTAKRAQSFRESRSSSSNSLEFPLILGNRGVSAAKRDSA